MIRLAGIGASGGAVAAAVALAAVALLGYLASRGPEAPTPEVPLAALAPVLVAPSVTAAVPAAAPAPAAGVAPAVPKNAAPAPLAVSPGAVTQPEPPTQPAIAPAPAQPEPAGPRFDVVRVEPDGTALIAGLAPALSAVSVLLDGVSIGSELADGKGGFVALLTITPASAPRVLSLSAALPDGGPVLLSDQTVILAPSAQDLLASAAPPPGAAPAIPAARGTPAAGDAPGLTAAPPAGALPTVTGAPAPLPAAPPIDVTRTIVGLGDVAPGDTPPGAPALGLAAPATGTAGALGEPGQPGLPPATSPLPGAVVAATAPAAPVIDTPGEAAPDSPSADTATPPPVGPATAPRILMADDQGLRVVQDPGAGPVAMTSVSIDTITYDAVGEVVLGGRGRADAYVRVYLDNDPIRTTQIDGDGQWRADLPRIDTRVYTLRVDEIEESGAVLSRSETPFRPEPPEAMTSARAAGVGAAGDPAIALVTVQPGFTLWRIARENYGEGQLYVRVFEANADKIRDPDLIYPGQIFTVPQ